MCAFVYLDSNHGIGEHVYDVSIEQFTRAMKVGREDPTRDTYSN